MITQQALQYIINYITNVLRDQNFYNYMSQNQWNNEAINYLSKFSNDSQAMSQAISGLYTNFKQALNVQAPVQNFPQMQQYQQVQPFQQPYPQNQGFQPVNMGFNNQIDNGFNRHVAEHRTEQMTNIVEKTNSVLNNAPPATKAPSATNSVNIMVEKSVIRNVEVKKSYIFKREEVAIIAENAASALSVMTENDHDVGHIAVQPVTILKTRKGFGSKHSIQRLIEIQNDAIDNFFIELIPLVRDYEKVFGDLSRMVVEWVNHNYKFITGDLSEGAHIQTFDDIVALRDFIGIVPRQDAFKDKLLYNKRLTMLMENIRELYFKFDDGKIEQDSDLPMLANYHMDIIVTRINCDMYYADDLDYDMIAAIVTDIYKNNKMYGFIATRDDVSEITINKNKDGDLDSYKLRQIYRL